jgi:hypothetical protein
MESCSPAVGPQGVQGRQVRGEKQPCRDDDVPIYEPGGLPRQRDMDCLAHILGRGRILHLPQRGGIDHVDPAPHERGKRLLRAFADELPQERHVGYFAFFGFALNHPAH